ncbi:glycosyltransferase family 2 protein [Faecalibacter bovis]|uniref:Glycosyltransferase family 2 protein n=1 Tax=Faecalibacter bovis TaxID=2898187 RepID=A0ABX7X9K3_9FLAO|nr:glycosyltransferase family 2 protein [Faecalibacter bovis]QTV04558.1 glycosyltransferase family 2 protein [Faecalibacter bovis]
MTRGFQNIIIIDNKSSYAPLLNYYKDIESKVIVEYMEENAGHLVFFENKILHNKYGKGYFVVTDADIVPNNNLPLNFMSIMINHLDKYFKRINKIGFALRIDDLPKEYILKDKVIKWEKRFWENHIEDNLYLNWIDTTFALYKPNYPSLFKNISYLNGIRIGGDFTSKHGGWYIDNMNLTEEQQYYYDTVNSSSSWRLNKQGQHDSDEYDKFI